MFYYIKFTEGDIYSVDSVYVDDVMSVLIKYGYTVQYK